MNLLRYTFDDPSTLLTQTKIIGPIITITAVAVGIAVTAMQSELYNSGISNAVEKMKR